MNPFPVKAVRSNFRRRLIPVILISLAAFRGNGQHEPSGRGSLLVQPPGYTYFLEDLLPGTDALQALLRTEDGFLWATSKEGLFRYDGYDQVCFRHPLGIADAKYANWFSGIIEDRRGDLWLGSLLGLQRFDKATEKLTRYFVDSAATTRSNFNNILCMLEDRSGTFWVGTTGRGLHSFDRESGRFARVSREGWQAAVCLCEDRNGELWVGTTTGVEHLDRGSNTLIPLGGSDQSLRRLATDTVGVLYEDRSGNLWAGSLSGLTKIDPERRSARRYSPGQRHRPAGTVASITEDPRGELWVGTYRSGLFRYDSSTDSFVPGPQLAGAASASNPDQVWLLTVDALSARNGFRSWLWALHGPPVGFKSVARLILQHHPFTYIDGFSGGSMTWIWSMCAEKESIVWAGAYRNGLVRLDLEAQVFTQYFPGMNIERVLKTRLGEVYVQAGSHPYVYDRKSHSFSPLFGDTLRLAGETRDGSLWFGKSGTQVHLVRLDPRTRTLQPFLRATRDSGSYFDAATTELREDREGILWFGTGGGGMSRLDPRTGAYRRYLARPDDESALRHNTVTSILEDETGTLWVGTHGGLHSFDRTSERFTFHPSLDRERDFFIRGLADDGNGNLWMACNNVIACFRKGPRKFLIFGEQQGLTGQANQYAGITFDRENRRIYVGAINKVVSFCPDTLLALAGSTTPKAVFTGFDIFDKPARLPSAITSTKEIVLPYSDNFFSFKFAVLDFVDPSRNRYAYKLDGFDRDWQFPFDRRVAYYTNVDPGEYIFRVKGSNSLGIWTDEGASVHLVITPPWWKTTWAYICYSILGLSILYGGRRYDRKRALLKHELRMEKFEAEKLREIDGMKMRFFANVSHEFRTPLTLILGPAEKLLSKFNESEVRNDIDVIRRSALRLLELINQLLDISKMDAGRMKVQVRQVELIRYVKGLVFSFVSLAERRRIRLAFEGGDGPIPAYVDRDKLQKIVVNLLSNAFKFTPEGGEIRVGVSVAGGGMVGHSQTAGDMVSGSVPRGGGAPARTGTAADFAEIVVSDTGIGIPLEKVEKIFDRFYQVDDSHVREYEGTGIGLALTRELVEIHHGHITVTSEPGKGSTFRVRLPLGKGQWKEEEIVEPDGEGEEPPVKIPVDIEEGTTPQEGEELAEQEAGAQPLKLPLVLIVEDNADARSYIRSSLTPDYRVLEAEDGRAGLDSASEVMPDLIVSDIMMPQVDGIELCRRLKTDERTSHIPVILLTARASDAGKLEGLETGADDYIIKPFDVKELQVRIRNLIELRRKLQEKYRRQCVLEPGDIPIESMDEKFLRKALEVVEQHLSEPDFETVVLAREVCLSRMQLNRKLQALTGRSTHEFIRNLRLQRAAKLLASRWGNVTEVAFEVGFSNLSSFARAFREQYGAAPSEYGAHCADTV